MHSQAKLHSHDPTNSISAMTEQDIWVLPFGRNHFSTHPFSAGTFGRWGRLGAAVSALCRVIAVNV